MTAPDPAPRPAPADIIAAAELLGPFLRSFMRGQFSSATLSFNDDNGPNYQSVEQCEGDRESVSDWVSDEERARGCATNSKWTFHWYPDTPVGFYALSASTLPALIEALVRETAHAGD